MIERSSVDLPQPEPPSSATISPRAIVADRDVSTREQDVGARARDRGLRLRHPCLVNVAIVAKTASTRMMKKMLTTTVRVVAVPTLLASPPARMPR